ncbi:MAG: hypothetical protein QFB86_03120 [Patescibacteria group bacterium]|nr:hypothetical protein [Patescibacteria group bacterium]
MSELKTEGAVLSGHNLDAYWHDDYEKFVQILPNLRRDYFPESNGFPSKLWQENIGRIALEGAVHQASGLNRVVNCDIIGRFDEGIALIMRNNLPKRLVDPSVFTVFVKPVAGEDPKGPKRGMQIFYGVGNQPVRNYDYNARQYLKGRHAYGGLEFAHDLERTLMQNRARHKRVNRL